MTLVIIKITIMIEVILNNNNNNNDNNNKKKKHYNNNNNNNNNNKLAQMEMLMIYRFNYLVQVPVHE